MKLHGTELKVGDRVWSIINGWGSLDSIDEYDRNFYIKYYDDSYKSHSLNNAEKMFFWNEFKIPKEAFIKPLPKLEVDTKVIVWNNNMAKFKRHFKEFNSRGEIVCFDYGQTSFTTTDIETWDNWELYKDEDV